MSQIKISVVIPVYNTAKYLKDALDSIIEQTLTDIEILCVDDGSTDESVSILKEYASKDNRVRILFQRENSNGAALARNMGINHARGKYLSILDSDDIFHHQMLEKMYNQAEKENANIVICNAYEFEGKTNSVYPTDIFLKKQFLPTEAVFSGEEISEHLMQMKCGNAWNCLFEREFINNNNIEFRNVRYNDDAEFVFIALALANRITILDLPLIYYRKDADGSQSSTRNEYPEIGYICNAYIKDELEKRHLYEKYKKTFVNRAVASAAGHLSIMKDYNKACTLFNDLKAKYLYKLGAFDIEDEDYYDKKLLLFRDRVVSVASYDEFNFVNTRVKPVASSSIFYIPQSISCSRIGAIRVVIYGAGNYGKRVYYSIINRNDIDLIAWVDRNFENLGEDIQSPDIIKNIDYDMVFVAVKNVNVSMEIVNYLLRIGVQEEKIVLVNVD